MEKYIKPSIEVLDMELEESILQASGVRNGGPLGENEGWD